jgi:hypothetical protein
LVIFGTSGEYWSHSSSILSKFGRLVFKTMTRSAEEVLRADTIDLKVLVEYIKIDLFPKAKLVLGKDEWDVGGTI